MPVQTIAAFDDHGTLGRTVEAGLDEALDLFDRLERLGVGRATSGRFSMTRAALVEEILVPIVDAHLSDAEALVLFERMGAVAHPSMPRRDRPNRPDRRGSWVGIAQRQTRHSRAVAVI
jgi:hypothetical protein